MQRKLLTLLLALWAGSFLLAQRTPAAHVVGDILVSLPNGATPHRLVGDLQTLQGKATQLRVVKSVSPVMNIWLLAFDAAHIDEQLVLQTLRRHPQVKVAQYNHIVEWRNTVPNDPQFNQQWQYINNGSNGGVADADLDIDQAWDITTGGVTITGDTIVVCILDDGIELAHPDYGDNIWTNHAEIPNNNIDDDENGYIDDVYGWNTDNDSNNVGNGDHGNAVSGIVGAKGNNGIGVSGVNWNVKLMTVKGGGSEANSLAAYTYPYLMRKRYNATNGAEGAFVVATNASWGTDFGQPADAPLWCAFYDSLGHVGIVSCGATSNLNINVDELGDLPTACPSDYLIGVTNMRRDDTKESAGYGATNVDLGAFGSDTWTVSYGLDYDAFGGTSGATPHVTGTVALLFAAPCPSFMALAKENPALAALKIKEYILAGTDYNESLQGITVTGGRLNINNALQLMLSECAACAPPFNIIATHIDTTHLTLAWTTLATDSTATDAYTFYYRPAGSNVWNTQPIDTTTVTLTGAPCQTYEVQLSRACIDTVLFTPVKSFTFDGCCRIPANLQVQTGFEDNWVATWDSVTAATAFTLRYKPADSTIWQIVSPITNRTYYFANLDSCTAYEVQIKTLCADSASQGFSPSVYFQTLGCGACTDFDYCTSKGDDASYEWIDSISIGNLQIQSGTNAGYVATVQPVSFTVGQELPVYLQPGFSGQLYNEYFRIFIDYNQDGVFNETQELAYDAGSATNGSVQGNLIIPANTLLGNTRMRVSMKYIEGNALAPTPCESFQYGEVEDYCVRFVGNTSGCMLTEGLDTLLVGADSIQFALPPLAADESLSLQYKLATAATWSPSVVASGTTWTVRNLTNCRDYLFRYAKRCGNNITTADTLLLRTDCLNSIRHLTAIEHINLVPNPASHQLQIELFSDEAQLATLSLMSLTGVNLYSEKINLLPQQTTAVIWQQPIAALPAGIYSLKIETRKGVLYRKFIKI